MKKFSSILFFIAFSYLCAVGQGSQSSITLVPAKSVAVVRVDWQKVRRDQQLKAVVKGDEFAGIIGRTGIDEASIRELVIFADASPTTNGKMGVIVNVNRSSAAIAKYLGSKGWATENIGGRTAYIDPTDGSYLLSLRNGTFVMGTKAAVEQTLDVVAKPQNALIRRANFRSIMSSLGTVSPINFFLGVPEEYRGVANFGYKIATTLMSLADFGILSTILDKIGLIQNFGLSINSAHGAFPVHLIAEMSGKTGAYLASGSLNLLKRGASMVAKTDADRAALKSMTFESAGNLLSIKMDLPQSVMAPR